LIAVLLSLLVGLRIGAGPFATNLTLTQAWVPIASFTGRLNNVSWSLVDEAFFYALFPFLFMRWHRLGTRQVWRRVALALLLTLLCVALVHETLPAATAGEIVYKFPAMRVGEFLIGMGLAFAMRRGWRSPVPVGAAVVIAGATYVGMSTILAMLGKSALFRIIPDYLMIAPFALLIVSAATADLSSAPSWRGLASRRLVLLGRASYQLYMTHFLLVIALRPVFGYVPVPMRPLALGAFVVASIVISLISYRCLEVPTERWLRARLGGAGVRNRPRRGRQPSY
jgi:peptidoglycan/LPS O-acetylase OafA/YrhL